MSVEDSSISSSSTPKSYEGDSNPNQRLCSVLLNEFNYISWSREITLALGGRSKLGYINGDIQIPPPLSTDYEAWLSKDQLVMSWLLNSMEPSVAVIFNYSESSQHIWKSVKEMYGNQNNCARVFQLQRDITSLKQGATSFVHHLGIMKNMWNEVNIYRPHTTDAAILQKRAEEDKVFQLLASLGPEYEDLRSHILMTPELPTLTSICSTIQREETRRNVMNKDSNTSVSEARAFSSDHKPAEKKPYRGKRPDLHCTYCDHPGHLRERCWILHPELKPKFDKQARDTRFFPKNHGHKANHVASATEGLLNFTANPAALINEFAAYIKLKQGNEQEAVTEDSTALLGKFAGFLAEADGITQHDVPGSSHQEADW